MKPKHKFLIFGIAPLIAVFGFFLSRIPDNNSVLRSSSENLSLISAATSIEAYRVKSSGPWGSEKIGHYFVAGKASIPNQETAKRLKAILISHLRGQANPHGEKACAQEPGVAVRFIQGDQAVDILLCFECADLMVVNSSGWRDFSADYNALIKVVKVIFPDEAEIQSLRSY